MACWWRKVAFPVKRALVALSALVKHRKAGVGLTKLHNEVQTCGYEDVRVMWEMLRRSEVEPAMASPQKLKRPFWRAFADYLHHRLPAAAAKYKLTCIATRK